MGKPRMKDRVSTATHSLNPDRGKQAKGSTMRTKQTIKRLNMYKNFKAKRDKKGHIVRAAPFQSATPSGTVSRVEPNRRWFGNTRVISQDALQNFKEAMKLKNPYEIMLRQTILPVSLLDEKKTKRKADILASASFSDTFGKKSKRKRPRLSCDDLGALMRDVVSSQHGYLSKNDQHLRKDDLEFRTLVSDPHFKAGTSKRLWNELFKVLDSSDVVLYVLDARDPMGTRSRYIENYMRKEKPHKHFIFVINKVDLVPVWITKRWKMLLSAEYPTLVFHASLTKPLGKVALMGLLRQLASLHSKDRHQISVGIIGYPNVGKSSIINAMRSKKVCKVAPLAGETKVWQYVTLLKSIYLIDCPGVVYPDGATEADLVMKGVVRVEYLQQPELYVSDVLARVKPEYLQQRYGLPDFDPSCHPLWNDEEQPTPAAASEILAPVGGNKRQSLIAIVPTFTQTEVKNGTSRWPEDVNLFLELVSKKTGKLLKGGEPDVIATAKRVLNDFQRGKLPYFVRPPPQDDGNVCLQADNTIPVEENLLKAFSEVLSSKPEDAVEDDLSDEKVFSENLTSRPDGTTVESISNDQVMLDTEVAEAVRTTSEDDNFTSFDLEPHTDDEKSSKVGDDTKKVKKSADWNDSLGLSGNRRRQLERALRKQQGRAGRHFYEEVSVKNRKGGGVHSSSASCKLSKRR